MEETKLAWAAGFADGEGHIGIVLKRGITHTARFSVANTHRLPLEVFADLFGGGIYKSGPYGTAKVPSYQWVKEGRAAAQALDLLYPYLVLKRSQVDIVRELMAGILVNGNRYMRPTAEEFARRDECQLRLKALHGIRP